MGDTQKQKTATGYDGLTRRILWGFLAGIAFGVLIRLLIVAMPAAAKPAEWMAVEILDPVGQVFLRLLFFVVIPLVFATLALGVLQLEQGHRLGPLALKTFAVFCLNMMIGVGLGLLVMNVFHPGGSVSEEARGLLLNQYQSTTEGLRATAAERASPGLGMLVEMLFPRNLLRSVVEFQLLPLIVFALLVGLAGTALEERERGWMRTGLEAISQVMAQIVRFALILAPYGVGALMASVVIKLGVPFLSTLAFFVAVALGAMTVHLFGTVSLLLRLLAKRSPWEFFRAMRVVLATAFSTSSSSATLPTTLHVCKTELGVSPATAGFVIPLGATMNMAGTALFEGCVVLFVAQVYGADLPLFKQFFLVLLAVLSAVAVAGIPGGSLPVLMGLLATFGLPPDGIALILGVDRILDMARTTVNVAADAMTACVVDVPSGNRATTPAD